VQELSGHEIERSVGKREGQIVLPPIDVLADTNRLRLTRRATERGVRDVDGRDVPALLGEPDRVGALPTAQIESRSGSRSSNFAYQDGIRVPAPDPLLLPVEFLPE